MFNLISNFLASRMLSVVLIGAVGALVVFIRSGGYQACLKDQLVSVATSIQGNIQHEKEIIRLDNSDLKRRYCKWMRDSEDECLQADIPLRARPNDAGNNAANSGK